MTRARRKARRDEQFVLQNRSAEPPGSLFVSGIQLKRHD
jgi:hypothetical protein